MSTRAVLVGGKHHGHVTHVGDDSTSSPPFEIRVGVEGARYRRVAYEVYELVEEATS